MGKGRRKQTKTLQVAVTAVSNHHTFTIELYAVRMNSEDFPSVHGALVACLVSASCNCLLLRRQQQKGHSQSRALCTVCHYACKNTFVSVNMLQHLLFLATLALRTNSLDLSGYGSVRRAVCLIVQKSWNKELKVKVYEWSQLDCLSCVVLSLTSSELRPLQVHQQEMGFARGKFSLDLHLDTEEAMQSKNHATVTADQQQEFVFSHLRKVCKTPTQMEEVWIESVTEKTCLSPP